MRAQRAYGLTVASSPPLPGLGAVDGVREPAVRIAFTPADALVPAPAGARRAGWEARWRNPDGGWTLRYESGPLAWEMSVRRDRICVRLGRGVPLEDAATVVETTGLAAVLHERGTPLLHGCAVARGDEAVLLLGSPGTGKSTAAAALVAAGHTLVTDDIAALDGGLVHSGPSRLRVYPDTAAALGWRESRRLFASPDLDDKRYVTVATAGPVPLRSILLLQPADSGGLTTLAPPRALAALLTHVFALRLLDPGARARGLHALAQLVREVPVRELAFRRGLDRLPDLVASVERA